MARNRVFLTALAISAMFHLSMVSVFSIVTRVPSKPVRYAALEIVHPPVVEAARRTLEETLQVSSPARLLEEELPFGSDSTAERIDGVPPVELPRLTFLESDGLRTEEQSLKIRTQFSDLFEPRLPKTPDSWALFTQEVRTIGTTLTRWALPGSTEEPRPLQQLSSPVPGVALYVEWMSEPKERKVLFAPPIPALWRLDPTQLAEPIAVAFTVNPEGKVTEVQTPVEDDAGVVAGIKNVLPRYLFEPLGVDQTKDQHGTLLVRAE